MKKILWFLLGFSLVAFPMRFVYADELHPDAAWISSLQVNFETHTGRTYFYMGTYESGIEAEQAVDSKWFSMPDCSPYSGGSAAMDQYYRVIDGKACYIKFRSISYDCDSCVYAVDFIGTPPTSWLNIDSDEDGIPDECDFYPDDSTKLNTFQIVGELKEDSSGDVLARNVLTPYGDYFTLGDSTHEGDAGYTSTVYLGGDWYEQPDDCSLTVTSSIDSSEVPQVIPYTWTGDEYDTAPGPGSDGMPVEDTDYESPDGTETDSELLEQISKNTASSVNSIQVMNENISTMDGNLQKIKINSEVLVSDNNTIKGYLDEINQGISESGPGFGETDSTNLASVDSNLSSIDTTLDDLTDETNWDTTGLTEDTTDYTTAISDAEAVFSDTGDITDLPTNTDMDIGTESFNDGLFDLESIITDAITGTAIDSMLSTDNFDFTGSGSFSWDYKGTPVVFTVTPYQSALNAWGSVILGIAAVCSVLIVFRR